MNEDAERGRARPDLASPAAHPPASGRDFQILQIRRMCFCPNRLVRRAARIPLRHLRLFSSPRPRCARSDNLARNGFLWRQLLDRVAFRACQFYPGQFSARRSVARRSAERFFHLLGEHARGGRMLPGHAANIARIGLRNTPSRLPFSSEWRPIVEIEDHGGVVSPLASLCGNAEHGVFFAATSRRRSAPTPLLRPIFASTSDQA